MMMEDLKTMKCDFITPAVAASVLKMDVGRLIQYARDGQLPFPVQISGNRVKISRTGFLQAYGYDEPEKKDPTIEEILQVIAAALTTVAMKIAPECRDLLKKNAEELLHES